jgi:hypothetical protein
MGSKLFAPRVLATLGSGQSRTMGRQFDPSQTGCESAYLNVCEDTNGTCAKVPLVGRGRAP